jgi:malate synthase
LPNNPANNNSAPGINNAAFSEAHKTVLTDDAIKFLNELHKNFDADRLSLLQKRPVKQKALSTGGQLKFIQSQANLAAGNWTVAQAPSDLNDRRVEITGPAEAKMIINALNCGARVFMADFEDSLSPTFENLIFGQQSLMQAVRKSLSLQGENGKSYKLNQQLATLVVRPRGLHLQEENFLINGKSASGSLFDFGLYFYHNAAHLLQNSSGPYFYLPKLESAEEAAWWNRVFVFSQDYLKIPQGSVRATVLIETITAAFEMDEILFVLKDHMAGLNAGRWDYIFSLIKKFNFDKNKILPDRKDVTMSTPPLQAYCELLVQTCHKRKAHAIGGMSAFIPNRREPEVTEKALSQVTNDKKREAGIGFDGTWVAHPDLVLVAQKEFDAVLAKNPNQKSKIPSANVSEAQLINVSAIPGKITEAGIQNNINVALQYIDKWLSGVGAAAIHNLMEDAATAEISRSQLWQWVHHQCKTDSGKTITAEMIESGIKKEVSILSGDHLTLSAKILSDLVLNPEFAEFLTLKAYKYLNTKKETPHESNTTKNLDN